MGACMLRGVNAGVPYVTNFVDSQMYIQITGQNNHEDAKMMCKAQGGTLFQVQQLVRLP